ncbi:MAG: hypothetical protein AUI16_07575 [Alphaproteobacteria bacterium 13_2_20CM_2_64_7]|jgi:hypothetical protein|nr:MAG: hypothetical protein AUI16_07575 [Alphaproteobacteria bacterium 13_2_20CM_2_64_7]
MAQNGFRMDGTPHEKVLDKGVVSKLEEIMKPENLPRVPGVVREADAEREARVGSTDHRVQALPGLRQAEGSVHILAVAQHEREMISERTKAALKAARARGTRLGNPRLDEAAKRGTAALKANAKRFAANVLPIIREIEKAGAASLNAIAAKLNERNVPTARGGRWTHVQVGAVLRPFADGAASAIV